MQPAPGGSVLRVSEEMVLATNAVLALSEGDGRSAGLGELADELAAPRERVGEVLARLARCGIIDSEAFGRERARLCAGTSALTLADIADAVGTWLAVASCREDDDPSRPGLRRAMSLAQRRIRSALAQRPIASYARAADV